MKSSRSLSFFLFLTAFTFYIFFSYWYPRFLVLTLGEKNIWISYLYTYGMGGIVFVASLIWIFTRKKDPLRQKEEFKWLIAILLGFLFLFFMQGLWIYLANSFPIKN